MKKILVALGSLPLFFVGAASDVVIVPANAFYDGTSPRVPFLAHVHALGFSSDPVYDAVYVRTGHNVCRTIQSGYTVTSVQSTVETELAPKGYTTAEADGLVTYAHNDLCPNAGR
jgi:hypothetical protein